MLRFILSMLLLCSLPMEAQVIFEKPPKEFSAEIEVAVCFIKVNNQVLFLKRQGYKPEGNTWGVPGGKVDPGETAGTAVVREIFEETGIPLDNENLRYLGRVYLHGSRDVVLHTFEVDLDKCPGKVKINPTEHQGYMWISLDKCVQLPLIPGESECIDLFYG